MKTQSKISIWIVVLALCGAGMIFLPAAYAAPLERCSEVYINVSNDAGVKYQYWDNELSSSTYWISMLNHSGGGLNPLHISTDPAVYAGQVTTTTNTSGTFYVTFTGGIGHMDDGVLMLAVNGTIPEDFSVHIRASGYNWTPAPVAYSNPPNPTEYNYVDGCLNETFDEGDFLYGPQIWKPCSYDYYPIFYGQDMANETNTFQLMFIDLNAGAFNYATFGNSSLVDKGAIKVEYTINNLPASSFAAFNDYGWFSACNWGPGIPMTNNVNTSGYTVMGV